MDSTSHHSSAEPQPLMYRNAMEPLVLEEIQRQFQNISPKLIKYIKQEEVLAFALNRLPALYATSEKGWQYQNNRVKREFSEQIKIAVRQGITAVQRDPLRVEKPLKAEDTKVALNKLKALLKRENLSWENLPEVVEEALMNTARGKITWKQRYIPRNDPWSSDFYRI